MATEKRKRKARTGSRGQAAASARATPALVLQAVEVNAGVLLFAECFENGKVL